MCDALCAIEETDEAKGTRVVDAKGFMEAKDDDGGSCGQWWDWWRGVSGDDHEAIGEVGGGGEGDDVGRGGCTEDENGVGGVVWKWVG